ncbi:MAG: discoidin domain-containing protein [Sedimentisphaerales bacterium]|nr:discoidin domain-containing protein [Sedimentisphaerales bacterium]
MVTARRSIGLTGVIISLMVLMSAQCAWAGEFSADLFQKQQLDEKTGRIYVKGDRYRMELAEPVGPNLVVIVDPTANKTRVLVPKYKMYMELPTDDSMSQMNDPFQAVEAMLKYYSIKDDGTEEVLGYECNRQLIHYEDQQIMHRFNAQKLGFPIMLKYLGQDDMYTELSNIKEKPISDDMFAIPEGYTAATMQEIGEKVSADPDMEAKAKKYEETRPRKAEISKYMTAGHVLHVLPGPDTQITIEMKKSGPDDQALNWYAALLKNGQLVEDTSVMEFQEAKKIDIDNELGTDEIILGITEGQGYGKVNLVGRQPLVLATAEEYYMKSGSGKSWSVSSYQKMIIDITCDLEEDSKVETAQMKVNLTKGTWDQQKKESSELKMAPGENMKYVFSPDDQLIDVDLSAMVGRFRVKVVNDQRPADQQKPIKEFSPDNLQSQPDVKTQKMPPAARIEKPAEPKPAELKAMEPKAIEPAPVEQVTEVIITPAPPETPVVKEEKKPEINVLAATQGTKVVLLTSQYNNSTWAAENLINGEVGKSHGYASGNNNAQEIIFELPQPARVSSLIINPFTTESPKTWVKEGELWGSSASPHRDFEKIASFTLNNNAGAPEGAEQRFDFEYTEPLRWVSLKLNSNFGGSYMELGEVELMGYFVESPAAPVLINVLAADQGATVLRFNEQYNNSSWAAKNLIDGQLGSNHQYAVNSSQAKDGAEIVFELPEITEIKQLVFSPYATESSKNWAKDVEVLTATEDVENQYQLAGQFTLNNRTGPETDQAPPDQDFPIEPVNAKFIKLRILNNHGGGYIEMGEFKVLAEKTHE